MADETEDLVMEHPMQLFRPEEGHTKLVLVPETVAFLEKIKHPVVLVTIVGNQRGGKSTLLNLLHSRQTAGFGLGHYMDPQTTGLWIWMRKHPRDEDIRVLLMDTEGLDSPHIPQGYNWTLSALSLLISTYFIYQTKGSIESSATDRLGVILKVADQIRGGETTDTDKPNFLWLIRDHQLAMKKAPKVEMMDKLEKSSRDALQRCFSDYDCVPLPRPVDKDELLKEVDNLGWDGLRSEFREEYVVLERAIFNAVLSPRHLNGQIITGEVMSSMVSKYSSAISASGGILTELSQLPTQRQMIAKMAGEKALKRGIEEYKKNIQVKEEEMPLTTRALSQRHANAHERAVQVFKRESNASGDEIPEDAKEYYDEFEKHIAEWEETTSVYEGSCVHLHRLTGGHYAEIWNKNVTMLRQKHERDISKRYEKISAKLEDGYKNVAEYYADVDRFREEILSSQEGKEREEMLTSFLSTRQRDVFNLSNHITEKREREQLKQFEEKQSAQSLEQNRILNERLDSMTLKLQGQFESLSAEAKSSKENQTALDKKLEGVNEWCKQNERATVEASNKLREKLEEVQKKEEEQRNRLESRVEEVKKEGESRLIERYTAMDRLLQEVKASGDKQMQEMTTRLNDKSGQDNLQRQIDSLSEKLYKALSDQLGELKSQLDAANRQLQSEFAKQIEKGNHLEGSLVQLEGNLKQMGETVKLLDTKHEKEAKLFREMNEGLSERFVEVSVKQEETVAELTKEMKEKTDEMNGRQEEEKEQTKREIEEMAAESKRLIEEMRGEQEDLIQRVKAIEDNEEAHQAVGKLQEDLTKLRSRFEEQESKLEEKLNEMEEKNEAYREERREQEEKEKKEREGEREEEKRQREEEKRQREEEKKEREEEKKKREEEEEREREEEKKKREEEREEETREFEKKLEDMSVAADAENQKRSAMLSESVENMQRQLTSQLEQMTENVKTFEASTEELKSDLETLRSELTRTNEARGEEKEGTSKDIRDAVASLRDELDARVKDIIKDLPAADASPSSEKVQQVELEMSNVMKRMDEMRDTMNVLNNSTRKIETGVRESLKTEINRMRDTVANMEPLRLVEQLKHSVDAIWESMGVLSGKIVQVEAMLDQHR
ncbi:hypothetical protein PROFUN_13214 [Planoprotostelium fungivorum]|uniref:GB1/RHD3-type G domain-containing protein n=1 Tax=Planoprotostelium fungivorum TaxID=1890364 RepID=A0A2P6MYT0_9EUKA|nr:hypothetical protein PROFUN_13214 [Planoprotostelium fungivorum]